MARIQILTAALVGSAILAGAQRSAGNDADTTGMEIVERSIDAIGGADAIASVKSFHASGSYSIPALGAQGEINMYYSAPGKAIFSVTFPNFGELRRGFDGTTAWSIDPQQGPRILEGDERDSFVKQVSRGLGLLPTADIFSSATLIESGEFNGEECHTVEVVHGASGKSGTEIFSVESGLLVGRKEASPSPQGELNVTYLPSEYKAFGGVTMPTKWDNDAGVQQWVAVYEEIHINEVDASIFALPEEIKALLD